MVEEGEGGTRTARGVHPRGRWPTQASATHRHTSPRIAYARRAKTCLALWASSHTVCWHMLALRVRGVACVLRGERLPSALAHHHIFLLVKLPHRALVAELVRPPALHASTCSCLQALAARCCAVRGLAGFALAGFTHNCSCLAQPLRQTSHKNAALLK